MKRFLALLFLLVFLPVFSYADLPDISGLSFDELVELKEEINKAIVNSKEWQEVTVFNGVWQVGFSIPAGKWTVKPVSVDPSLRTVNITYCDGLNAAGTDGSVANSNIIYYNQSIAFEGTEQAVEYPTSLDIDCKEGMYIIINHGMVSFTPYAGKPDLGFK